MRILLCWLELLTLCLFFHCSLRWNYLVIEDFDHIIILWRLWNLIVALDVGIE